MPEIAAGGRGEMTCDGRLEEKDHNGKANSRIKGKKHAMLPASDQTANVELRNRRLHGIAEMGQPVKPARAGHNVGLFHNFAKRAEIRQKERKRGCDTHYAQTDPGAHGQFDQYRPRGNIHRAAALLEKAQKPIRRQP